LSAEQERGTFRRQRYHAGAAEANHRGTRALTERVARPEAARYRGPRCFQELSVRVAMSVDAIAVRRIAHLARIGLSEEETPHLQGEINAILAFVEALNAVDVDGVEPMTSVIPMRLPMRDDVVTDGEIAEAVLANAPLTEDGFFLVPKVIE
jgi:aspartyl-tRNA(Asn)/glutamyl-tRNA(Gln) amidotransferase subunit C